MAVAAPAAAAATPAVAMMSVAEMTRMGSPHCLAMALAQMTQILTQNPTLAHE
jgi:hypothetical protein